jgi:hypothetical protein
MDKQQTPPLDNVAILPSHPPDQLSPAWLPVGAGKRLEWDWDCRLPPRFAGGINGSINAHS